MTKTAVHFSNATIGWFLDSATPGQMQAVDVMLKHDAEVRRRNRHARLLRRAKFPAVKSVEDFDNSDLRFSDGYGWDDMLSLEWVGERQDFVFHGPTGRGKTWIGCALGVAACNAFFSVRYVRLPEMLDDLCVKKDEEWARTKKKYVKCDLLIIDDWMLEPLKEGEAREVLEIVEARNTRGSLMLCSQFAAGGWAKKLGGDAIAEAIVDRIVHNSYVVHIEGDESMRKRMSSIG